MAAGDGKYGRLYTEEDVRLLLRRAANLAARAEVVTTADEVERIVLGNPDGLTFAPDEPLFLLRGQDDAASVTLRDYLANVRNLGASTAHQEGVEEAIRRFAHFAAAEPERVKVPD